MKLSPFPLPVALPTWFAALAICTTQSYLAMAGDIRLLPAELTLHHSGAIERLNVTEFDSGVFGPSVKHVQYQSSNPEVAKVVGSVVHAVGDGTATITATDPVGRTSIAAVTVQNAGVPVKWNFRNDVESILAKQGCNMGACHGALAGKGGFRLSLRGYDPEADYAAITRHARGRRVEMGDPGRSLLLAKPTGALPHKGGLKLDVDSRDYEIMSQWIAAGTVPPMADDSTIDRISVLPPQSLLKPGDETQVLVRAHYDDERQIDVSHWAQFTATDQSVADVDDSGHVTVRGSGQAAISVWFGSKIALANITVPYQNEPEPSIYTNAPRRNFIDSLNLQQLAELNLQPSPRCDDATFLRRASVDAVGRLPTESLRDGFYHRHETVRRDWLIDQLLASEDYTDYWTYKWSDVLLINGTRLRPLAVKAYYDWLHDAVQKNQPWDELTREILTSTGSSFENGATNFFALNQTPEDMTENACQAFMGLSIGCAKCHNHPLEKWTNDQYYAMANLFSRVRAKGWGGEPRNGDGKRQLYVSTEGELIQPNRGRPQPPTPLEAEPMEFDDPQDRRVVLADWMTSPENPYFSRSITNRVWANFYGRGLVEQVDDLRQSNPASNEALLAATAEHLVDVQFDLKALMRTILQSETYQRSSFAVDGNADENRFHSRYYPRRLMAEVLLDSIDQVLGTNTSFVKVAFPGADYQDTDFYGVGTRAIELYDSAVDSYFLKTFGRNPREITCECERDDEPSMVQVLHLSNGETLNPKLNAENSFPQIALRQNWNDQELVQRLFIKALSREPSAGESATLLELMAEYGDDRETAARDVTWSILTSTEFTFNH